MDRTIQFIQEIFRPLHSNTFIKILMKTNNEKWQGSSKGKSTTGASRDGKSFEKRDVKSLLKGSRGGAKFDSNRPSTGGSSYGEKKPWENRDSKPSFGDKKPWENKDSKPSFGGDRKPWESNDSKPSFRPRSSSESREGRPSFGDRKPWENNDSKPTFRPKGSFESRDSKPSFGDKKPWENNDSKPSFRPKGSFESRDSKPSFGDKKPWENRDSKPSFGGERKPWENRDAKPSFGDRKPSFGDKKPWESRDSKPSYGGAKKPWETDDRRPLNTNSNGEKVYGRFNESSEDAPREGKLSFNRLPEGKKSEFTETRYDNKKDGVTFRKPLRRDDNYDPNAKYSAKKQMEFKKSEMADPNKPVRLNKYLANAGICSRREADEYIKAGIITVNGQIVTELGVKVLLADKVMFHEQTIQSEKKVYLLLNKPKDCVTTSEDTHERLTVLDLVKNACSERIYPVGRLDRNTTGVLLLTNDGDMAAKLTHPKYDKKKIYHVALDKPLERADFDTIMAGVTLDDTVIAADALEFVKEGDLKQIGIEIHSGQNRVVRRIFEKLGYKVVRLDRVYFAGLTKKSLPRGKYRFLSEREVQMLKMGAHE